MEGKGPSFDLEVGPSVVGALEQVTLPRGEEEGFGELTVRRDVLENAPASGAKAPPHDAQLGHGNQEIVDRRRGHAVLHQHQNGAVVRMDVLADGERRAHHQLQGGAVDDGQPKPGDQEDAGHESKGRNK